MDQANGFNNVRGGYKLLHAFEEDQKEAPDHFNLVDCIERQPGSN